MVHQNNASIEHWRPNEAIIENNSVGGKKDLIRNLHLQPLAEQNRLLPEPFGSIWQSNCYMECTIFTVLHLLGCGIRQ
uniref:Uncharacterized protein n=1 Tax=Arundo donax TaxID=35708 RepID=A0A0A8Y956_ARUDO